MKILKKLFYSRDTALVAQELLGKIVVRVIDKDTILKGRIVETEAYMGASDPACHAYGGKRVRNAPLYGPVGYTYVYFTYGMHSCLNFVARTPQESAGGVLIRAIEPLEGIAFMEHARHTTNIHALCSGPGKITQAFSITRAMNGIDVTKKGVLYVLDVPAIPACDIVATVRIGISKGVEDLLRFHIKGNKFASRKN